jgi:hypothetical protein
MPAIQILRPNVTREDAIEHFSGGVAGGWRSAALGPLRLVADIYIPFHIFEIEIESGGRTARRFLGVDAVNGSLDPYEFGQLPDLSDLVSKDTRNCLELRLREEQGARFAVDKARRMVFGQGFFRVRNLKFAARQVSETVYLPYWVGFWGRGPNAGLTILDAVRRRSEGSRMRTLLQDWLEQEAIGQEGVLSAIISMQ